MLLEIQKRELFNIEAKLRGMGCTFAIIPPEGEKIGDLEVKEKKSKKHKNPRQDYSGYKIPERIKDMQVGEVIELKPDNGVISAKMLASNLSSHGIAKFGKNNFRVCVSNGAAQGMRCG